MKSAGRILKLMNSLKSTRISRIYVVVIRSAANVRFLFFVIKKKIAFFVFEKYVNKTIRCVEYFQNKNLISDEAIKPRVNTPHTPTIY